jgi:hypothetical protein
VYCIAIGTYGKVNLQKLLMILARRFGPRVLARKNPSRTHGCSEGKNGVLL